MEDIRDIKRANGKAIMEIIHVPMHKLEVTWYDMDGNVVDASGETRGWMFQVSGPGIDTKKVAKVEFPTLSYDSMECDVYAKVYQFVWEDK